MNVQQVMNRISQELSGVKGIVGVVIGGSRARGTHDASSDIDIGIYYDEAAGFDVSEISRIAATLDDEHRENIITALGEWGPWVNGGGWLMVQGYHVDFLFRDIKRVSQVIEDCLLGKVTANYQVGHPHAYMNVMYMGEIAICNPLFDPTHQIAQLKAKTMPYPKPLRDAIIGHFRFELSFSFTLAQKNANKDDISYVAGHVFRTISSLNQVLFAINEEYCINEKRAVRMIEGFNIKPNEYKKKIDQVITLISSNRERTEDGIEILQELLSETEEWITK